MLLFRHETILNFFRFSFIDSVEIDWQKTMFVCRQTMTMLDTAYVHLRIEYLRYSVITHVFAGRLT